MSTFDSIFCYNKTREQHYVHVPLTFLYVMLFDKTTNISFPLNLSVTFDFNPRLSNGKYVDYSRNRRYNAA